MPSFKTVYDKEHLSGDDLVRVDNGRKVFLRLRVTIDKVIMREMRQSEEMGGGKKKKLLAYFVGKTKYVILNSSNCDTLLDMTGTEDYEKWRKIECFLTAHEKEVFKKLRHVIDILPVPKEEAKPAPAAATAKDAKAKTPAPAAKAPEEAAKAETPGTVPATAPVEPGPVVPDADDVDFDEDVDDAHDFTDPEEE